MRRILETTAIGVTLALVVIAWTGPALAETCKYHKFSGPSVQVEPRGDYDACYTGRVRGTLKGQFTSCFYLADFWASDWLWGDGNNDLWAGKGDDFLETSKGEIFLEERAFYDLARTLAAGEVEVIGGTGDYEGATGVLQFYNKYPNRLDVFVYEGQICTP